MRNGGGFRLLGVLLVIGVIAALTAGAYSAGFVAGAGTSATNVSPWVYGGAFGASGIVGLIVTVLILVVILRVLRFAFWATPTEAGTAADQTARVDPAGPADPADPAAGAGTKSAGTVVPDTRPARPRSTSGIAARMKSSRARRRAAPHRSDRELMADNGEGRAGAACLRPSRIAGVRAAGPRRSMGWS